jgi:hypothetical protein
VGGVERRGNRKEASAAWRPELGGYTGMNPGNILNNGINSGYPTCHGIRVLKYLCPTLPGGS